MPRLVAAFCLAAVAAIAAESNQASQGGASPAFEVASITPVGSANGTPIFGSIGFPPGGQFVAQNIPLVTLVRTAYPNFGPGRIAGGPDWIRTELVDITAKAAGNPPRAVLTEMLKQLLADRFKLKVHPDRREINVYALVLARRDGRLGPGLRRSRFDCTAREAARVAAIRAGTPPPPRGPRKPGEIPECDWGSSITNDGVNRFVAGGDPLLRLVAHIQANVGRAVVDRTGLTGQFDISLEHAVSDAPSTSSDPGKVSPLFTAVQEQLGLRLESRKERMEVLVIDEVKMPTPN